MERDFMGLHSRESIAAVKEELSNDGLKDPVAGFNTASGIQWPFTNRVSALPHFMSFKGAQEDKAKRIVTEPQMSSGFMPISTSDAFDSTQKRSMGDIQKSFNQNRQGGTHFSMTAYPTQHDVHLVQRPHDMKMFAVCKQPVSVSMGNSFFNNHFAATGATVKQQLLGGVPVTAPCSVLPTMGSIAGITEQRNSGKSAGAPAQLTIFYGGEVNVYENITPEKAQAIMFLAGSAPPTSNKTHLKTHVQAPSSKPAAGESSPVHQSFNSPPFSGLASPLSVSSHTGAQSGSGSTSTDEHIAARSTGVATTPVSNAKPPRLANVMGSITATTIIPSAVPQARKASLARFLEKRKERVMSASPYNLSKKSAECTIQESMA